MKKILLLASFLMLSLVCFSKPVEKYIEIVHKQDSTGNYGYVLEFGNSIAYFDSVKSRHSDIVAEKQEKELRPLADKTYDSFYELYELLNRLGYMFEMEFQIENEYIFEYHWLLVKCYR